MGFFNTQEETQTIRELVFREQLQKMLPSDIELIEVIFCAQEMMKQYNVYHYDAQFKPN
jgi:hypothetical protein